MNVSIQSQRSLAGLQHDITKAADAAGVPCDAEAAYKALSVFREFFLGSPVSFRTTTKPVDKRALSVRYMEFNEPHDPFAIALQNGLIATNGHPIDRVIPQLQAGYSLLGYGVDVGMSYGLEKIWAWFSADLPREEFYPFSAMPSYLKQYEAHFRKYGIQGLQLVGLDYRNKTFNLYFGLDDDHPFTPERLTEMLHELGFEVPPPAELTLCLHAKAAYYTFSWDSDQVERLCFVTVAPQQYIPTQLHPLLNRYVTDAPFLSDLRLFFMNPTYARQGNYLKIENDYTGTFGETFRSVVERPDRKQTEQTKTGPLGKSSVGTQKEL